jgi:hypothetical protein
VPYFRLRPFFFIAVFLVNFAFHAVPSFHCQCLYSTCLVVLVVYVPINFNLNNKSSTHFMFLIAPPA